MKRDVPVAAKAAPPFILPQLPFDENALAPIISARTVQFHYGKHHRGYVDKLNLLVEERKIREVSLVDLIRRTHGNPGQADVFNNAAQVWNHNFYWQSLAPAGGEAASHSPAGALAEMIEKSFGGLPALKTEVVGNAMAQFGSGWVWLLWDGRGLRVTKTSNAHVPFIDGNTPLITVDVWEHAYYLDYQNQREAHVKAVVDQLVNWTFAAKNLERAKALGRRLAAPIG
jgi:Fe-Mn family superoxide dismutase